MSTPITPRATGRRDERDGTAYIVFERVFRAPIEDVWAAVTEPERLQRWIGTWSGEPADGRVDFFMTAEGDDVGAEAYVIEACEAPSRLELRSLTEVGGTVWHLILDLAETDGVTTLVFGQEVTTVEVAESVGPGWDYYLDRLVTAETGGEVTAVDFGDYYPAFAEHYRAELS
ncbi:SRPBCC family protein [Nocardioides sp. LHG3406-4]|uniref:SRPBCC family protein n=1 Tax=Nocardioides sp. LHG3406-4 TaxID=2804575 RepID=UPI003CF6276A